MCSRMTLAQPGGSTPADGSVPLHNIKLGQLSLETPASAFGSCWLNDLTLQHDESPVSSPSCLLL